MKLPVLKHYTFVMGGTDSMNSCISPEELRRFVLGPLNSEQKERVIIDHIIECLDCRNQVMAVVNEHFYWTERRRGDRRKGDRRQASSAIPYPNDRRVADRRRGDRRHAV
ncbi:MAG TPA: hypothetical protein VGK99_11065 [Acidobacteriota bacterium]